MVYQQRSCSHIFPQLLGSTQWTKGIDLNYQRTDSNSYVSILFLFFSTRLNYRHIQNGHHTFNLQHVIKATNLSRVIPFLHNLLLHENVPKAK